MSPSRYSTGPAFVVLDDHRPIRLDQIEDRLAAKVEDYNAACPHDPAAQQLLDEVRTLRTEWLRGSGNP
ncbi:MAG: hypothetical protein H3C27_01135 [Opitutaceae bacterium]|nr:hypothetical protein [Opitutaceae bacterium]